MQKVNFPFDNSYFRDLPDFYLPWQPEAAPRPSTLFFNQDLAQELKLASDELSDSEIASIFSGNSLPQGANPIAQAYAGHQFGRFSPRLGDGRALLLGELIDAQGKRRDIAFKGSGRTPFSRGGDGKAAVGPMLREVLIGEAMATLGIPTTRALAVVATGDKVYRDKVLPGAVLTRVADSHLRVGTFEFFSTSPDTKQIKTLADYAIARHFPALIGKSDRYLEFLKAVANRQAILIAKWMSVGFIHGVMNTDNMSIAGETIDYGPCAFMEAYDLKAVFSSIDEYGRYAYGNQPRIANWNLSKLAEALLAILAEDEQTAVDLASAVLNDFYGVYRHYWLQAFRAKLSLNANEALIDADIALIEDWLDLLQLHQVDFTLAWRYLADVLDGNQEKLFSLFLDHEAHQTLDAWITRWLARSREGLGEVTATEQAFAMRKVNPWIIPRNHLVEEALEAASTHGDLAPFEQMLEALKQPYAENVLFARYAQPAPARFTSEYRTFCGT